MGWTNTEKGIERNRKGRQEDRKRHTDRQTALTVYVLVGPVGSLFGTFFSGTKFTRRPPIPRCQKVVPGRGVQVPVPS